MAKKKPAVERHLPDRKNAPKKTGPKRGVGGVRPLDESKDFEQPTKKAEEEDQPELLETPKEPPKPTVVKGRFEATILPPIYSSAPKSGDKLISIRVSLALTDEHEKMFPKIVEESWKWVKKPNRPKTSINMPAQTARFYLAHDVEEEELGLPIAKVTNANLAVIQKKGDGTALKIIRFQFRLQVPWSAQVSKFVDSHYNLKLWLEMKTTQEKLFDEGDEE
jgi:hypothetical protein